MSLKQISKKSLKVKHIFLQLEILLSIHFRPHKNSE